MEVEIIAQNEIIAALERCGRDAREARAIRAQLWLSQEVNLAEMERLLAERAGLKGLYDKGQAEARAAKAAKLRMR